MVSCSEEALSTASAAPVLVIRLSNQVPGNLAGTATDSFVDHEISAQQVGRDKKGRERRKETDAGAYL